MSGWDDDRPSAAPEHDDEILSEEPPLSREERERRANAEVRRLTRYGILLSVGAIVLGVIADLFGVPGANTFVPGLAIGCAVAVLNLRLLAQGGWAVLSGEGLLRALLGFGFSFVLLVVVAFWLVQVHTDWLIGFGVGLGLPAIVGLWYGFHLSRQGDADAPSPENEEKNTR